MALRIKELRRAKGLTQEHLSEMTGISRSQVSEIENEAKPVNTLRLSAIARALGVEVEDLFASPEGQDVRRLILDVVSELAPEDQAAVLRHARALASRSQS